MRAIPTPKESASDSQRDFQGLGAESRRKNCLHNSAVAAGGLGAGSDANGRIRIRSNERREENREQSEGATATGACSGGMAEWNNTSLLARASTAEITKPRSASE
jgi:hypothetical protein